MRRRRRRFCRFHRAPDGSRINPALLSAEIPSDSIAVSLNAEQECQLSAVREGVNEYVRDRGRLVRKKGRCGKKEERERGEADGREGREGERRPVLGGREDKKRGRAEAGNKKRVADDVNKTEH